MLQERLLDTKRNLQKLANQAGKSMEDILKLLCEGNYQFGEKASKSSQSNDDKELEKNKEPFESQNILKNNLITDWTLKEDNSQKDQKVESMVNLLERGRDFIEQSILDLNKATTTIMENIVDQMVTKKIYKIRQSFRELILSILGVQQMSYYLIHESKHIEFQDFSSNFITQIMESDVKNSMIQKIIAEQTNQFSFFDLTCRPDLIKLFQLGSSVVSNKYYGVVVKNLSSQDNQNISYCLMIKIGNTRFSSLRDVFTNKLIIKIIQISSINTTDDSAYMISKIYAKKMLDLLQMLIIQYDMRLKKSLCQLNKLKKQNYYNLTNIVKIMLSKIDQHLANQQMVFTINKLINQFQEMQYKKIQDIRVYKKYIRQDNLILLQFNRLGILNFISGNRDNPYLNDLTVLWEPSKPILDLIFKKLQKFDSYLKKAVKGVLKSERPIQIDNQIKAKIKLNGKKIQKILIMIESKQKELCQTDKNIVAQNQIILAQKNQNTNNTNHTTLRELEKLNPGILNQGWIDLFLKGNINKNDQNMDLNKKRRTFMPGDNKQVVLKIQRQLSQPSFKQSFRTNIVDVEISNPDLNFLAFNDYQLQSFAIKVFDSLDYFQNLPQQRKKLLNFISDLHDNYQIHGNPFHNFKHGINVMHSCYLLSKIPANFNILTVKDIFVNVFSGLCHDVGHTGFTNAYEIASNSKKAMIYNDRSPLQNFHASLSFQLLRKQENNFLCHMERDQFVKFRKAVIQNILYTDIKQHFPLLNSFNQLLKSGKTLGREDAPILSYMIVHSSDFSGSVKQFQICKEWSRRVNLQFSNQYRMQGEIGIPQTPFMKDLTNPVVLSKAEGGFLKVIVYPLYQALDNLYVMQGVVHKLKKNVEDNIKAWEQMNRTQTQKSKALEQEKNQ